MSNAGHTKTTTVMPTLKNSEKTIAYVRENVKVVSKEELQNKISAATNMVEIKDVIITEVTGRFINLYIKEVGLMSDNETVTEWMVKVRAKYDQEMKQYRIDLFNEIPSRFYRTAMYNTLKLILPTL